MVVEMAIKTSVVGVDSSFRRAGCEHVGTLIEKRFIANIGFDNSLYLCTRIENKAVFDKSGI